MNITDIGGIRYYKCPDGGLYPSVTTINEHTRDNSGLEAWRKRVGEEEANKISKAALKRGTKLHENVEAYVRGESLPHPDLLYWLAAKDYLDKLDILDFKAEERVYNVIEQNQDGIKLANGYAGTLDLLFSDISGWRLVDFKTSDKIKQEQYLFDYWLQVSAYSAACKKRFNIVPRSCELAICLPNRKLQRVTIGLDKMQLYWEVFKQRVKEFYMKFPTRYSWVEIKTP